MLISICLCNRLSRNAELIVGENNYTSVMTSGLSRAHNMGDVPPMSKGNKCFSDCDLSISNFEDSIISRDVIP